MDMERRVSVPIDRLLLGRECARLTEGVAEPSKPVPQWPHLALFDGRLRIGDRIRINLIRRSDCFLVAEGHQAVVAAYAAGAWLVDAEVVGCPSWTPFQQFVLDIGWLNGRAELYQPVPSAEFGAFWHVIRACQDRLDLMISFLVDHGLGPTRGRSYLDVGSCYGWFVAQMLGRGYDARGIEVEPMAPTMGQAAYGLAPERIAVGDCVDLLKTQPAVDVMSCLSLVHHFLLGRGGCSAEELVGLLCRQTRRVLFLDTAEDHEAWFRDSLSGWNPHHVREWLLRHTDFDEVVALGIDRDSRPPYQDNYGRTLFACVRGYIVR